MKYRRLTSDFYEKANHLGNVHVVITDKRKSVCDEELGVEYFVAEVLSGVDYYPFGMVMLDRQWYANSDSGNYRFAFNGKEIDRENGGAGNVYDYGFRIYNPALGKFLSVDPLTGSYPWYTPYQFAGNTPIQATDLDGAEPSTYRLILEAQHNGQVLLFLNDATTTLLSPFVIVGSAVSLPIINQSSIIYNEGVHEGGAYNSDNKVTKHGAYKLNENWQFVPISGLDEGMHPSPEAGAEVINATIEVVLTPFTATGSLLEKVGWSIIKYGSKKAVTSSVTFVMSEEFRNLGSIKATHQISGDGVRLREAPGTNSTVLGLLYTNTKVSATGNIDGDWTEVETQDGGKGWVSNDYVQKIEQEKKKD